jgi:peptidoglycan/xylan/chitin deacetylase (PgdA/CDA1 family)/major membrane immunogen (membrane-anchored lipoprotein)
MTGFVIAGTWTRRIAIAVVPALAGLGLAATPAAAVTSPTVVSLTFTDGHTSQYDYARPVLQAHGMKASFYVASAWVDAGSNSSMVAYQLRNLYRDGDEIGGMGKDHKSLTDTSTTAAYKQAQVCDDKARLTQLGLDPQTFAYPQAAVDAAAKQIVQGCGYRAGRTIGGLAATSSPYAESIPPTDAYNVRTANFPTGAITLSTLQAAVNAASSHGGGWLPMSFTQVCHQGASTYSTCMASSKAIDDVVFSQFLDWLQATGQTGGAPVSTTVRTVRDVMGAPIQPPMSADPTTVALTFNDGNVTQYKYARPLLKSNNLNATFYVPTNWIDKSFAATMAWWQLDDLYRDGNELGGMGRDHKDLTDSATTTEYKTAQVCDDRQRLVQQGYDPQTFDYPAGAYNAAAKSIVQGCGYAAARASGGLSATGPTYAETVPPKDSLAVRTSNTTGSGPLSLANLENAVTGAAAHGGGLVPLSLTQVCHQGASDYTTCMQSFKPVDDAVLGQFLAWLKNAGQAGGAPAGTQVKTLRDALGIAAGPVLDTRPLAVSVTFDDSDESQFATLGMLNQHNMHATYFINTGAGHMGLSWSQVQSIAAAGNDIGGHTLSHIDMTLPDYSFDRKYHEVCDNRADLFAHGYNPVSFAYPFGSYDDVATGILRHCGYQSGRRAGGINSDGPTYSETVPASNAFVVRTLFRAETTPLQLSDLTTGVEAAANHGGGWLPLVFHEVCYQGTSDYSSCMQSYKPIDSQVLSDFLDYLSTSAPTGTSVKDVAEVLGGGQTVPVVSVSSPSPGQANVAGNAAVSGSAASDGGSVSVAVYAGQYVTDTPLMTFNATNNSGAWSATPASPLADGTYTVQANQARSGLTGHSVPVTFTVAAAPADTTAPVVTVTAPVNGSTVKSATPLLSGTGGQTVGDNSSVSVTVYAGSTATGTPVQTTASAVAADGSWSTAASTMPDGTYNVQATQGDAAGNTGTSNTSTFTVDTTPADTTAPVVAVTAPVNGSTVKSATPLLSGTGGQTVGDNSSVTVQVYSGATATGSAVQTATATLGTDGSWSTAASTLPDGTYTVQASQSDAAGNTGTNAVTFTVNTTPADTTAPVVTLTAPADGATVKSATPTVSGTGGQATGDSTSVTVQVYSGGTATGTPVQTTTATIAADGSWSKTATTLPDGTYTGQATQSDAAGNTGTSNAVTFTVNTTPVDSTAPVVTLTAPADGATVKSATPTVSGTGGQVTGDSTSVTVQVYSGGTATGAPVQTTTATVAADGSWSKAASTLPDGPYTVQATQSDAAGNTGTSSAVTFTVDTTPADTTAPAVAITAPADGATVKSATPTVSGTGGQAAGDNATVSVKVYSGSSATGTPVQTTTATVAADGSWSKAASTLPDGTYTVQATQSDAAGNTGASAVTFTVDTTPADTTAPAVAITAPADGSTLPSATPTVTGTGGTANTDNITLTLKVYAGSTATGTPVQTTTATIAADGSWSKMASTLPDGTYTVQATQSDTAGNTGTSTPVTFTVDTTAPAVAITSPTAGAKLSTSTAAVSGTAGNSVGDNATVSLRVYTGSTATGTPSQVLTSAVQSAGSWSANVTGLVAGTYTVTATQADSVGNSRTSAAVTFTVSATVTSVAPAVLGQGAAQQVVKINGTGFVANSTVAISGTGLTYTVTSVKAAVITLSLSVASLADVGARDITVTKPDGGRGTCSGCFTVTAGPKVTSVAPSSLKRGTTTTVTILGSGFDSSSRVTLSGLDLTQSKLTLVNPGKLTVSVKVGATAATGGRSVTVTNGDGGTDTLVSGLTITT